MTDLSSAARQDQFLEVIDRDEAERRFHAHLALVPCGNETVPLDEALDRVLADDVLAAVDVPGFDRANVDGFALQAADTFGATRPATKLSLPEKRRLRERSTIPTPRSSPPRSASWGANRSLWGSCGTTKPKFQPAWPKGSAVIS